MPATFAHCLLAQKGIDKAPKLIKTDDPKRDMKLRYAQKIGEKNSFVVTGAAGPDYPYLTDILTTSILQVSHTWANRMHYESTLKFIQEGVKSLSGMEKNAEEFCIRLAWFCGFVSHVVADSYLHPVINSIVHGTYIFTHTEHARCELIQDVYIFKKLTEEDIVSSNPREGKFGYLHFLNESSDPDDEEKNRIHPEIRDFWKELLETSHPDAKQYFDSILPDRWHHNYRGSVNFIADPGAIFRHVIGLIGRDYMKESEIPSEERVKYIDKIKLPNGEESDYDTIFEKALELVTNTWLLLFEDVDEGNPAGITRYIKDWDLDTGVDGSLIDLWRR